MRIPPSALEESCFFLHVYVCVCICVHMCVGTCMWRHICTCVRVDGRNWSLVFFSIAFSFIYWYRISHSTWCSPIQAVELASPRDRVNQLIKSIYYIFYIPTKISPFSSPLSSFPISPMCFSSIHFSSVPVQKAEGLPWVPTKHGRANCSKTIATCIRLGKASRYGEYVPRVSQNIRDRPCSHC